MSERSPFTHTASPSTDADVHGPRVTARWEDIDAELACSTREMCVSYGTIAGAETLAALGESRPRPWATSRRERGPGEGTPRAGRDRRSSA